MGFSHTNYLHVESVFVSSSDGSELLKFFKMPHALF